MNIDEFVLGQNIAHYRDHLETEANKAKQQTLRNLLAEAEAGFRLTQTATRRQSLRKVPHAEPIQRLERLGASTDPVHDARTIRLLHRQSE